MECKTICDLCGSTVFDTIYEGNIDFDEDAHKFFSSSRKNAGHWPIVKCVNCGLHRSNPRDDDESLKQIYTCLQDETYDDEENHRLYIAKKRLKSINSRMRVGKMLDLGCATGLFAEQAHQQGWQVTGVDSSKRAILQAKDRCPEGHFYNSTIEEIEFPKEQFDLITLWDVLEHVPSPTEILFKIRPWLRQDGWIVINIPNINSRVARVMRKHWTLLLREHIWYFSPKTISQLFQKTGFETLLIESNWVKFSLKNILTRMSQYTHLSFMKSLGRISFAKKIGLKFPIGEMQVYARKK